MKTKSKKQTGVFTRNLWNPGRILSASILSLVLFMSLLLTSNVTYAHCDTMDGPLIADAKKAIDQNNVNYVLKWVPVSDEAEIRQAFDQMMKVRGYSTDAKEPAEKYFFEILVRVHRAAEGVPFTGVKPSGTPIDEKIMAADKSIETGNLSPIKGMVPVEQINELTKRFDKVMALKNFDVNDVIAGRQYIAAYVQFFKFAEGEEEGNDVQ